MSTGAMIAFLPSGDTSWCKQPLTHLTLVYAGDIADLELSAFNALAKDAITVARMSKAFTLDVIGIDVFGDEDEKVDVPSLQKVPHLHTARKIVEHWNASEYKEFAPHVTVGPQGSAEGDIPTRLYFDRVVAAWGNRQLVFHLGPQY